MFSSVNEIMEKLKHLLMLFNVITKGSILRVEVAAISAIASDLPVS